MGQPNILIADAAGLNTQPNELTLQSGALVVAKNVEITRDGVIEVARGFEDFSGNLPDFRPEQLFVSDRVAYAHVDGGWWYFDETTERWLRKRGALGGKTSYPFRIVYTTGHLYLTYQNFIADLDLATGRMSVLAGIVTAHATTDGTGIAARFWVPAGMAIVGGNLYVCDELNHTIRKVVIATGVVTTIAGTAGVSGFVDGIGTAAKFYRPYGIVSDGVSMYVADQANQAVRKMYPNGYVATISAAGGYAGTTMPRLADGVLVGPDE